MKISLAFAARVVSRSDRTLRRWAADGRIPRELISEDLPWVRLVAFGDTAKALDGLTKRAKVYGEGCLKLETWLKDGSERSGLTLVAFRVEALGQIGRRRMAGPLCRNQAGLGLLRIRRLRYLFRPFKITVTHARNCYNFFRSHTCPKNPRGVAVCVSTLSGSQVIRSPLGTAQLRSSQHESH